MATSSTHPLLDLATTTGTGVSTTGMSIVHMVPVPTSIVPS